MVAVFVLDGSQRCRFLNAVAEVLGGVSAAEAAGRPLRDILWKDNPETYEESALGRVIASKTAGEGDIAILDRNHIHRALAFRVVPIEIAEKTVATVVELVDLSGETGTSRALRESEQRLRLATEATGIGIWDVNGITGERRWSPEFSAIVGLPADIQPSRELFLSVIHPEDREHIDALYSHAYGADSGGLYNAEFRIVRADNGEVRWVATTGRVSFDAKGRPLRALGTLRDIHERRQSEEALRESEERLRIALFAGRMGMWRSDFATGRQQWDAVQYQILGVDPAVEPSRELFMSLVLPEDRANLAVDPSNPPSTGTFLDSEFRIVKPGGGVRWIGAHAITRNGENGRPAEMIGVNFDITAQKEAELALRLSEERHRLAIEANEVGTWDFDIVNRRHMWSDQFKRLWGLSADDPSDPELLRPLVEPAQWEETQRQFAEASDPAGSGRLAVEYQIRRADTGERRWCAFSGKVFFDEAGKKPIRAIGIMMDTTARRATEEKQRRVLAELHHRIKNSLTIAQAIVSQTLRAKDRSDAFDRIQSRLMSLARAHDFLSHSEFGEVPLRALLLSELQVPGETMHPGVVLQGAFVVVNSEAAIALALAFHELTQNAARFGSLSVPNGRLDIAWQVSAGDGPELEINWTERGGPAIPAKPLPGLGMRLIETSLRQNLNGSAEVGASAEGLRWHLRLPLAVASVSSA
jgi:PAS domain S-box-containing protein